AAGPATSVPARLTRYITTPCDGTVAAIVPEDVEVLFDQRSFSVYGDEPPKPLDAAVVETVVADAPRLRSTTANEPSLIGLPHTSVSPLSTSRRPCEPPQSWLTEITSGFSTMDSVAAETE